TIDRSTTTVLWPRFARAQPRSLPATPLPITRFSTCSLVTILSPSARTSPETSLPSLGRTGRPLPGCFVKRGRGPRAGVKSGRSRWGAGGGGVRAGGHPSPAVRRSRAAPAGAAPAEPVVRALLDRAVRRLHLLCASLLYRSYPRLTRPPLNLQAEELLGA